MEWVKNIYWIGGSSCSGKSSCAKRLSERMGISLYNTDSHAFGEHMFGLQDESRYPAITHYRNNILKGMDAFAKSNTENNFHDFLSYCREVFPLLLDDIKKIAQKESVIVEGAHILPGLVAGLANPGKVVFLVSSKRQQKKLWLAEMNQEIPGGHPGEIENYSKSDNKKKIRNKRVELHQKIAVYIKKTARSSGLFTLITDYNVTEENIDKTVLAKFFPS